MIYTGNGKGKTTAALGQMLRAWGWDMKVVMFQFIKATGLSTGEHRAAQKMNLDIRPLGTGFTWNIKDNDKAETIALEQWNRCKEAMTSGQFDMIILDEVSYALNSSWIPLSQMVDAIKQRPPGLHIVLTGRNMPAQLIEIADLATEMKEIKHHYRSGIKAQKGIEH
jgi:cob(I)alamin adenosyltransferase